MNFHREPYLVAVFLSEIISKRSGINYMLSLNQYAIYTVKMDKHRLFHSKVRGQRFYVVRT